MNPVAISIGPIQIRWYAIILLVAIFVGIFIATKEGKRLKVKGDFIFNICFWAIIMGFLSARLYYVLFNLNYYSQHPIEIIQIWRGGLAIHGGIIGAIITIYFYCRKYNARPIRYFDILAVPILLSQAIGRWGNFINAEAHGAATTFEHLKALKIPNFIIEGMKIDGIYYTPSFLYESIACLILFLIFLIVRRGKYRKVGSMTALYLIGYGIIRFIIEIGRTDALTLASIKVAQLVSIIMIIIGIIMLIQNKKKGKFEDLYNDPSNMDNLHF